MKVSEMRAKYQIKPMDSSFVTSDRMGFSVFLNTQTKQSVHEIA